MDVSGRPLYLKQKTSIKIRYEIADCFTHFTSVSYYANSIPLFWVIVARIIKGFSVFICKQPETNILLPKVPVFLNSICPFRGTDEQASLIRKLLTSQNAILSVVLIVLYLFLLAILSIPYHLRRSGAWEQIHIFY